MAKPAHPAKEKVSQWISKTDDKKPFGSKSEAANAAVGHFPNEGLSLSTVQSWISGDGKKNPAIIERFAAKQRGGGSVIGGRAKSKGRTAEPTDFAGLQAQLARIQQDADKEAARVKQSAVKALISEAKAVGAIHAQYENANAALEANIKLAAEMTGQKVNEIKAAIDAALNS